MTPCRKKRIASKIDAEVLANRDTLAYGVPMKFYFCEECNGWHLTRRLGNKRRNDGSKRD